MSGSGKRAPATESPRAARCNSLGGYSSGSYDGVMEQDKAIQAGYRQASFATWLCIGGNVVLGVAKLMRAFSE